MIPKLNKRMIYIRKQQKKVIFICFFLFFIPFLILVSYLSIKENEAAKENFNTSRAELNTQLQLSFDNILMSINRISYLHMSDIKVETILLRSYETKGIQYVEDNIYMNNLTNNLLQLNPLFYDITFISKNGEMFSSVNATEENEMYVKEAIRAMEDKELNFYVLPQSKRKVMLQEKMLFSSLTRLIDYNKNTVGYLFVDIDFRNIQTIIDSVDNSLSQVLLVGTDNILTSNQADTYEGDDVAQQVFAQLKESIKGSKEPFQKTIKVKNKNYTCLVQPITSIKASVIQYYESPNYFIDFLKKQGAAFFVCFMLMVLVLFVISRNSSRIFGPIEALIGAMKETGKGNFQQIDVAGNVYEINLIIERYNKMIGQLDKAINENYISQLNQKNMELKMLQAQINPHFIYNTLNLISSMSILNDVEEISYISDKLSGILRYNIKKGDIVYVQEEMRQVEDYLYIQRVRFSNSVKEEIEVDEEVAMCPILKFLIQPLVENCIFHGLELQHKDGKISICIKKVEENIIIAVSDNGVGMDADQLQYLQEEIRKTNSFEITTKEEGSIGIKNVASRIRAFYGGQYGLTIESRIGEGTKFCMKIPFLKE